MNHTKYLLRREMLCREEFSSRHPTSSRNRQIKHMINTGCAYLIRKSLNGDPCMRYLVVFTEKLDTISTVFCWSGNKRKLEIIIKCSLDKPRNILPNGSIVVKQYPTCNWALKIHSRAAPAQKFRMSTNP